MGSSIERVRAGGIDFYPGMATYGIPAAEVDGMDVLAVRELTEAAVSRIRSGEGPQFIEAKKFRFVGLSLADGQKYRGQEEVGEWEQRDPLSTFPLMLINQGIATASQIEKIEAEVDKQVKEAVQFAEQSPEPDPTEIATDVFA